MRPTLSRGALDAVWIVANETCRSETLSAIAFGDIESAGITGHRELETPIMPNLANAGLGTFRSCFNHFSIAFQRNSM